MGPKRDPPRPHPPTCWAGFSPSGGGLKASGDPGQCYIPRLFSSGPGTVWGSHGGAGGRLCVSFPSLDSTSVQLPYSLSLPSASSFCFTKRTPCIPAQEFSPVSQTDTVSSGERWEMMWLCVCAYGYMVPNKEGALPGCPRGLS